MATRHLYGNKAFSTTALTPAQSGARSAGTSRYAAASDHKHGVFVSTEQTGTGSAQNIAHGLGVIPSVIFVAPTDTSPATVGVYTVTEGTHTTTNVVVTVTTGKKYKVLALL